MFSIKPENLYKHPGFVETQAKGRIYVYSGNIIDSPVFGKHVSWHNAALEAIITPEESVKITTGSRRKINKSQKQPTNNYWSSDDYLKTFLEKSFAVNGSYEFYLPKIFSYYVPKPYNYVKTLFGTPARGGKSNVSLSEFVRYQYWDANPLSFGTIPYTPS